MYLLDTNTLIYFFKGMGGVGQRLFAHAPHQIFVPSIVVYELEVGIAKSSAPQKRREQLALLLEDITIVDFGAKEAKIAAVIRANLEQKGTPIGAMDTLIAGCALVHGYTLITHNTKEFSRIEGLSLEDWF